ncbi:BadF/BadG/BcrA/BcrD ATPase family protein [Priestia aryabhattai]
MNYIIGVDGGGTKTEAVAYDLNGHVLSQAKRGHGNLLIDEEEATDNILHAIKQCMNPLKSRECTYIYIGLAGYDGFVNKRQLEKVIDNHFKVPYTIANDAIIAHAALLKGKHGILTISGTGSISIGITNDITKTVGGWGHILGDEGSGYWIALQAFINMTKENDQQLPISKLSTQILKKLEYENIAEIKKFIYSASKGEIASFVPIIVEQANHGDKLAENILIQAGQYLAEMTLDVYKKLNFNHNVKIAVKGSILTDIPLVQQSFMKEIKKSEPLITFVLEDISSTLGCYYLALQCINS